MSSLGINVGQTGGSMLSEAVIAARGIAGMRGHIGSGFSSSRSSNGNHTSPSFLSGGLAGAASRQFHNSAVNAATNQGGNIVSQKAFQSSLAKGGDFANSVISSVAKGNISSIGSITGDMASQAITSYMGYSGKENAPQFSDVEIGGGRITGTETSEQYPKGIEFGMYSADQYMAPTKGNYDTVEAADGSKWYRQYATDTVERIPYTKENGKIAYHEQMVSRLPDLPKRKDKA